MQYVSFAYPAGEFLLPALSALTVILSQVSTANEVEESRTASRQ
jgi:hypothetical protein